MTIEGAAAEAVQRNLGLLAERANVSIAEAGRIAARLRPNPVLSGGADSLDWLGTGFNELNGAGPPQYAVRVDCRSSALTNASFERRSLTRRRAWPRHSSPKRSDV